MYLTFARNLALFFSRDTIHGIPTLSATPGPSKALLPSVISDWAGWAGGAGLDGRGGGSNALAGWILIVLVLERVEPLDVLRTFRGMVVTGGSFAECGCGYEGGVGDAISELLEPSRRMTGSEVSDVRGVRASCASSVEAEAERWEGTRGGIAEGGGSGRREDLESVEAADMLRVREEMVSPLGFDEGATEVLALPLVAAGLVGRIASRGLAEVGATVWRPDGLAIPV
jgi:hypothetical protein